MVPRKTLSDQVLSDINDFDLKTDYFQLQFFYKSDLCIKTLSEFNAFKPRKNFPHN